MQCLVPRALDCTSPLPVCFLAAAPYLTHTAAEGGANVGGRGQLHGGLHAAKVEEGVQVEALALARRGTQHRASAIHPQAAVLVEALSRHVVPTAQGQWLGAPQNSQSWGGRRAGLAREWPPALPHLTQGVQGGNFLQPPGVPQGTQERCMDLPEVTHGEKKREGAGDLIGLTSEFIPLSLLRVRRAKGTWSWTLRAHLHLGPMLT